MAEEYRDEEIDENSEDQESLEEEIRKLKKMVEDTLMDVRILISELENPFQYLAKYVPNLPEVEEPIKSGEEKTVEKRPADIKERVVEKPDRDTYKAKKEDRRRIKKVEEGLEGEFDIKRPTPYPEEILDKGIGLFLPPSRRVHMPTLIYERALLVGDFLLKTFGKDSVHKMLHLFYRRGLITTEIYMTMLDIIENLNLEGEFVFIENKITPEDYILALYLLNKILDVSESEFFLILLLALKKTYESRGSSIEGVPPILTPIQKPPKEEGEEDA